MKLKKGAKKKLRGGRKLTETRAQKKSNAHNVYTMIYNT